MDLKVKQYLERASNELRLAMAIKIISESSEEKEKLGLKKEDTFYSSVISHSYYAIFYSAKAILLTKNITTDAPEVHKKTLEEFKINFVDSGILDLELLKIYSQMIIRADELLSLFQLEKRKRGLFVYKTLPQANIEPANESVNNAKKFVSHIKQVVEG
ncbi:HEPN domain-containing protein [Candidatus Woesearchaeota archaeon]|nr:HEPN domain-containing protein [Candidatus Woesearchaeota archaeon]